jgi:hypothetical protein
MYPSKDCVFPGIHASAWINTIGAISGKEYKSSEEALAPPFLSMQAAQLSIRVLM